MTIDVFIDIFGMGLDSATIAMLEFQLRAVGKISQCITTTKHSKAKTVCIFLGIYCMHHMASMVCCCWCVINDILRFTDKYL